MQDITEKQTLLEQLQHSDALYKQAQAISRTGNWSWELATRKMEWSDELYHIYELTPGTVTESILTASFNHPDDRAMIAEVIKRAIETLEPFDFHYRIVLKSGKTKILHAMGTTERQPGSNGYKMVGTLQDVTEQKTAEKQLKEYKEFIEKITDVTPCIITTYNIHTGKYSFVNDEIEKKLGYTASQLLTEGVAFAATLIHPDDVAQVTAQNQAALAMADEKGDAANEPVMEFKYRLRNKAGEYRWFHTYGTVFERNEKGKVESVLNVSVDISMQEAAQQALQLNNIQLQQSNTSLEEYAYVASHDLKEPLRKIATFADRILATQYDLLSADGKVYLEKIIDASRRMQKLISDLLSVSTILGNKAFEPYDLNDALYDTLQQLDQKIEEKKAVITCAPLPMATVVPQQFRQLFLNLVNNALKFSRPDEPLQLQIKWQYLDAKDAEQYGIVHARRYLKLEFADNGIGFDNQYAGKIFAIFQRLHGKVEYEGTGIGLAVCKKIAENHGGIIYARGVPGKSAIFTLIIPA